jgi:tRNA-splicing ligase RtcB (3'-phosphate/5'-hydroxy nucleic acid ligase)
VITIPGKFTTANIIIDQIDDETLRQIVSMVNHPAFTNPIKIMPDTHAGAGSVIGFTMKAGQNLIPNIVGVDIGCGMLSLKLAECPYISISPKDLDARIREAVPFGFSVREKPAYTYEYLCEWLHGEWKVLARYMNEMGVAPGSMPMELFERNLHHVLGYTGMKQSRFVNSIGTLGGGNHFIEIGQSKNDGAFWITIHTGSRNFGKELCDYHQKRAVKRQEEIRDTEYNAEIERIVKAAQGKTNLDTEISEKIDAFKKKHHMEGTYAVKGLEMFHDMYMCLDYLSDMTIAQQYAAMNRSVIGQEICKILKTQPIDVIESVHNYIDTEDLVIRKGAVRSYKGQRLLIPFNMKDGLLVCVGKSNPEWNNSAPHGAGRNFSRSQAKQKFTVEEFQERMVGVFSMSIGKSTLDESPMAYKDSDVIRAAIQPTAEIVDQIVPIHNLKAGDGE